jgi:hypothetical protein
VHYPILSKQLEEFMWDQFHLTKGTSHSDDLYLWSWYLVSLTVWNYTML